MVLAPTVQIASLSMPDTLIIMVIALVVFGPRRLPQIGRQIGKLMYEFRKASNDFKFQMEEELRNSEEADRRKKEEERLRALALAAPPIVVSPATPDKSAAPETTATVLPADESPNPAAGYDNGPVASAQFASVHEADTAPTIMPPSIGETVAAARGWSQKYEQARATEVERVVEPGTTGAPLGPDAPSPAAAESSAPEPAPQPAVIAVNHHG
jgi:sec-independent protein translocase protein TatB